MTAGDREIQDQRDVQGLATPDAACDHDAALGRLYQRHASPLTRFVCRILLSTNDSADIVQDIFVHAWQHADRYDARRGTVGAWLTMMARSRALDVRRARHAVKRMPAIDVLQPTSASATAGAAPDYALLRASIALLPERQRVVVDLAYFEGLSHVEIADSTGSPLGTVKTRLRMAVQNLRLAVPGRTLETMVAASKRLPVFNWLERRLLPDLADLYFVDLVNDVGRLQRTDWGHADSRYQEELNVIWRFVPAISYAVHPVRRVLQTGRPELVPEADAAWQRSVATSAQHLHFMERVQLQSLICHPLTSDGHFLGSLTLARIASSEKRYSGVDVAAARAVAGVVAAALLRH